jgi:hypothetical protein
MESVSKVISSMVVSTAQSGIPTSLFKVFSLIQFHAFKLASQNDSDGMLALMDVSEIKVLDDDVEMGRVCHQLGIGFSEEVQSKVGEADGSFQGINLARMVKSFIRNERAFQSLVKEYLGAHFGSEVFVRLIHVHVNMVNLIRTLNPEETWRLELEKWFQLVCISEEEFLADRYFIIPQKYSILQHCVIYVWLTHLKRQIFAGYLNQLNPNMFNVFRANGNALRPVILPAPKRKFVDELRLIVEFKDKAPTLETALFCRHLSLQFLNIGFVESVRNHWIFVMLHMCQYMPSLIPPEYWIYISVFAKVLSKCRTYEERVKYVESFKRTETGYLLERLPSTYDYMIANFATYALGETPSLSFCFATPKNDRENPQNIPDSVAYALCRGLNDAEICTFKSVYAVDIGLCYERCVRCELQEINHCVAVFFTEDSEQPSQEMMRKRLNFQGYTKCSPVLVGPKNSFPLIVHKNCAINLSDGEMLHSEPFEEDFMDNVEYEKIRDIIDSYLENDVQGLEQVLEEKLVIQDNEIAADDAVQDDAVQEGVPDAVQEGVPDADDAVQDADDVVEGNQDDEVAYDVQEDFVNNDEHIRDGIDYGEREDEISQIPDGDFDGITTPYDYLRTDDQPRALFYSRILTNEAPVIAECFMSQEVIDLIKTFTGSSQSSSRFYGYNEFPQLYEIEEDSKVVFDEVKSDEVKSDEVKSDEVKASSASKDNSKSDDFKSDDFKSDGFKASSASKDNSKST